MRQTRFNQLRGFKIVNHDGRVYAVFENSIDAEDHEMLFPDCRIVCCGQHDNAYDITHINAF